MIEHVAREDAHPTTQYQWGMDTTDQSESPAPLPAFTAMLAKLRHRSWSRVCSSMRAALSRPAT